MGLFKKASGQNNFEKDDWIVKDNYIQVSNDFNVKDLKPYQKLVVLRKRNIEKKFVIDFSITKDSIQKLNNESLEEKTSNIITNKPFRLISNDDIKMAKGLFDIEEISIDEEVSILKDVNIDPVKEDKNEKVFIEIDDFFYENTNDDEKNFLNNELKKIYEKHLIFDYSKPIEMYDEQKNKKIIIPFKLREVSDEWKNDSDDYKFFDKSYKKQLSEAKEDFFNQLERSFFKEIDIENVIQFNENNEPNQISNYDEINKTRELVNAKISIHEDGTYYIDKLNLDQFNTPDEDQLLKKEYDNTLFFKKPESISRYNDDIYSKHKNFYNNNSKKAMDEYQQIKVNKLNNMIIIRKKINKKLLKEKEEKGRI